MLRWAHVIVGIAWIGFDQPKNLGNKETGGGLALPIWIGYMQKILKDVPVEDREIPEGLIQSGGEYHYAEYPPGTGVRSLGLGENTPGGSPEADKTKDEVKNELF